MVKTYLYPYVIEYKTILGGVRHHCEIPIISDKTCQYGYKGAHTKG